ncbi:hypothetical protein PUNSTDRAFT_133012 [Punctularia strigosozonata HHB-11173 SS5]|uniref:uncharacterized protein n=1 Tax=Punctularia strigosozonata (strain HHB-11173) TaxID=741275 RepID=UPI0004417049|nr:uncharacterized protein PUNSTDRAFT_133012 [Punctularia strigosozonata HHB-11173 SS5]EIN10951.1 hypothetical protein PUNSTDRAFT_133012 [Punctularia strigosozonata HHB-11173 SS5]
MSADTPSPTYISSRSADVVLSDVRPIKLKIEALRCINVLLDEILWSILNASRSLTTDHLNAGLRRVLPTSLGKEALLEAEVELRAYLERTASNGSTAGEDAETFDLQYAFELLRLKCEAYSTLNDSDEDPDAERSLQERMIRAGSVSPPKPHLVAQAALYLTAILEAVCEHTLGIVGRVAARDSSRNVATVQDLFVALCEDDSMYGLFKSMKVYEQIEALSKMPQPRRSKSFSRNGDRNASVGRNSPSQDLSRSNGRARLSSDSSRSGKTVPTSHGAASPPTRTSFEKARALKMLIQHNRGASGSEQPNNSGDRNHSMSESIVSDETRQMWQAFEGNQNVTADAPVELQSDFDDLMRSGSTMKMSLTPDRLRSMEMYKQERNQRGVKRVPPPGMDLATQETSEGDTGTPSPTPKRPLGGRRPVTRVDSIREDEEEKDGSQAPQSINVLPSSVRPRQTSMHPTAGPTRNAPPDLAQPVLTDPPPRSRSFSASANLMPRRGPNDSAPPVPATPQKLRPSPTQIKTSTSDSSGMPKRKHKVAQNRESMDLDDIMGGGDYDEEVVPLSRSATTTPGRKGPATPKPGYISKNTQDLIDFLSSGPPDADIPVMPKTATAASFDTRKTKTGRLQRMVSGILSSKASAERLYRNNDDARSSPRSIGLPPVSYPTPPKPSSLSSASKVSLQNVTVVTKPPRPPYMAPLSPPSSPSQLSSEDLTMSSPPTSRVQREVSHRKAVPRWQPSDDDIGTTAKASTNGRTRSATMPAGEQPSPTIEAPLPPALPTKAPPSAASVGNDSPLGSPASTHHRTVITDSEVPKLPIKRKEKRASPTALTPASGTAPTPAPVSEAEKPVEDAAAASPPSTDDQTASSANNTPILSQQEAHDLRKLLSKAATADECRLLVDIFLGKSGVLNAPTANTDTDVPYPSPSPSVVRHRPQTPPKPLSILEDDLQNSIVGLLLADA